MRRSLALLALALALGDGPAASAASAGKQVALAADLRKLLAFCHARVAEQARRAGQPVGATLAQEISGSYGRIAVATGDKPCALSFELASATMTDVVRIVHLWVMARDRGATFRDPRADGGRWAIWALRGSTLKLDLSGQPLRGRLVVTCFPATR
jgi:hypothetical protein